MADISRSADDIIIDNMKTAIDAFVLTQSAGVRFKVERDRVRPPAMKDMPFVNIWLEALDPQREGSSSRSVEQEVARINIDCYAAGSDQNGDGFDESAAMARLYYLKQQVKYALFKLINADYGLPAGTIAKKKWPSWQLFQNELNQPESEVVAGRWKIEIEYQWAPEDITGTALDEIAVNSQRWAALYTYEEA